MLQFKVTIQTHTKETTQFKKMCHKTKPSSPQIKLRKCYSPNPSKSQWLLKEQPFWRKPISEQWVSIQICSYTQKNRKSKKTQMRKIDWIQKSQPEIAKWDLKTFAGTDEKEPIRSDRTVEQVDDRSRMAMAHKRYRHLLLLHLF